MIIIRGKYGDYVKEIQASHKLGYPAYRIASEGSRLLYLRMKTMFIVWELILMWWTS